MRHKVIGSLFLIGLFAVTGCADNAGKKTEKALKDLNVIDQSNMNDVMLTVGDPNQAVDYFAKSLKANPERVDLKRYLAKSLVRAERPAEAAKIWREVAYSPAGTSEDRVLLVDALIRNNDWKQAQSELGQIPPTYETFERYRLEAMVADSNKQWKKADSFYETAFGLTTTPSGVLNNWGFSKMSRGDYAGAEKLFTQSLTYDPQSFTAKNNLVMARAAQREYDLPIITMTQDERSKLLYTAALAAIKQGDVNIGRTLLQEAVDTSPYYFEEAARALAALDANVKTGG